MRTFLIQEGDVVSGSVTQIWKNIYKYVKSFTASFNSSRYKKCKSHSCTVVIKDVCRSQTLRCRSWRKIKYYDVAPLWVSWRKSTAHAPFAQLRNVILAQRVRTLSEQEALVCKESHNNWRRFIARVSIIDFAGITGRIFLMRPWIYTDT
jgi:hypothetical protein